VNTVFFRILAIALALGAAEVTATEFPPDSYAWNPFTPVKRPSVPPIKDPTWAKNPIDAFVAAEHQKHGLHPRPEASARVLLRRLYLDLIGLPPSVSEQIQFLEDPSSLAYENLVDRLLASPHYGERWGRHWMDIWRYADRDRKKVNDGSEIPEHMWHWRDWIVASLNAEHG